MDDADAARVYLGALTDKYPTAAAARAAVARLKAALTLPKGTVHVISDIHGEFEKLKHVINNGSGSLRGPRIHAHPRRKRHAPGFPPSLRVG